MAQLSSQEVSLLRRLARWNGRLVRTNAADEATCARHGAEVKVVRSPAAHGLVTRPLTAPNHLGRGSDRACLAPPTERGRPAPESAAACSSHRPSPC